MTDVPTITVTDIVTTVNMIDICTERGAFKGNELMTVGTLREKFAGFVKANTPQVEPETTTESEDESGA